MKADTETLCGACRPRSMSETSSWVSRNRTSLSFKAGKTDDKTKRQKTCEKPTVVVGNVWVGARGILMPLVNHPSPLLHCLGRERCRKVISRFALR